LVGFSDLGQIESACVAADSGPLPTSLVARIDASHGARD
jgi:hypothetical protein